MTIKTLIALRELAEAEFDRQENDKSKTHAALEAAKTTLEQAEVDGADEDVLRQYRREAQAHRDRYLHLIASQARMEDVLDDLDAHDWH